MNTSREQEIPLDPKYVESYRIRSSHRKNIETAQSMLVYFDRAVEQNPESAIVLTNRGILKHAGLYDDNGALIDFNRALDINPVCAITYHNRGLLKHNNNIDSPLAALEDYNRAIEIDDKYASSYNNIGILQHEEFNNPLEAFEYFNKAIEIRPSSLFYTNRANVEAEFLDNISGAFEDYITAIKCDSSNGYPYQSRAYTKHYITNDLQGALTDYNLAIEIESDYGFALLCRAHLNYYELQEISKGIVDIMQSIKIFQTTKDVVAYDDATSLLATWKYEQKYLESVLPGF